MIGCPKMADGIAARISLIGLCIHYKAAAPDIISMSSLVMTACLVRLYVIRSLSIISPGTRNAEIKSAIGLFTNYGTDASIVIKRCISLMETSRELHNSKFYSKYQVTNINNSNPSSSSGSSYCPKHHVSKQITVLSTNV